MKNIDILLNRLIGEDGAITTSFGHIVQARDYMEEKQRQCERELKSKSDELDRAWWPACMRPKALEFACTPS